MNHTRFWIFAAIVVFVIIIGLVFSVPHVHDVVRVPAPRVTTTMPIVTVHDTFKKGIHTIAGSIEAPDACTIVTPTAILEGNASSTESILIAISMPADTGVCLQIPTVMSFSTTIAAPPQIPITATVNGSVASTTPS